MLSRTRLCYKSLSDYLSRPITNIGTIHILYIYNSINVGKWGIII